MFIERRFQFVSLYDAGDKPDLTILTGSTGSTWRNSSPIASFSNTNPTLTSHNTLALPVLFYGSETWTIKARDPRRITAAEMKYMRRRAGYTWTDYNKNNTSFGQITGIQ